MSDTTRGSPRYSLDNCQARRSRDDAASFVGDDAAVVADLVAVDSLDPQAPRVAPENPFTVLQRDAVPGPPVVNRAVAFNRDFEVGSVSRSDG